MMRGRGCEMRHVHGTAPCDTPAVGDGARDARARPILTTRKFFADCNKTRLAYFTGGFSLNGESTKARRAKRPPQLTVAMPFTRVKLCCIEQLGQQLAKQMSPYAAMLSHSRTCVGQVGKKCIWRLGISWRDFQTWRRNHPVRCLAAVVAACVASCRSIVSDTRHTYTYMPRMYFAPTNHTRHVAPKT
jgi:hypothetical protein